MSLVIDASVFVAASRPEELHYAESRRFLEEVRGQEQESFCPVLVLPECAAAIARATGSADLANEIVTLVEAFPRLHLIALDRPLAGMAVEIAGTQRLRGADSIYVAVAEGFESDLVTWDNEMRERAMALVTAYTPTEWIDAHRR